MVVWGVAAKAAVNLAGKAAVSAGAFQLVNRQINKYFPNAEGQQLDDIEKAINGLYGLFGNAPFGPTPARPGQCNTLYRVEYSYQETYKSNNPRVYRFKENVPGPVLGLREDTSSGFKLWIVHQNGEVGTENRGGGGWGSTTNPQIENFQRQDGEADNCGSSDKPNFPNNPLPPNHPGDFGGIPGSTSLGIPYFDANGNLRMPFTAQADDGSWTLEGSIDMATGEVNFGETVDVDGDGLPDYDKKYPPGGDGEGDGSGDDSCVKLRICGEANSDTNAWPITVPDLFTQTDDATYDIESLPQAIAWLARNIDAISGQYPITLEIEDTDPITRGNQSQTINLPNQAEAMAELFGLAYEANTNSELAVNMLFRLIPEVIAAKNSSLTSQDYTQAMTNWLGFRTKNVQREIDSNFNPLSPDSLVDFLSASKYKVQGVEDDDPHTLVEWVQQFKYAAGLVKASLFRGADLESELTSEMQSVVDNQPKDSSEAWEKFIDALNRSESNLTDRTVSPRPRATSVDDVLDIGTVLPDRDPNE